VKPVSDQEWENQRNANHTPRPTGPEPVAKDDFLDIMRIFQILLQRKRIVVLTLLFFMALGGVYIFLATAVYSSTSVIELHIRRPRIAGDDGSFVGEEMRSSAVISDTLNTEFQKLQSINVMEQTARELRRRGDGFPWLQQFSPEELVYVVANQIEFSRVPGTFLVHITARAESPELAALIANTYADMGVEVVKTSTREKTMQAVEWLSEQIDVYKQELLNSEARIIAFQRKHNIDGLKNARITAENALIDINTSLVSHQTHATTLADMVTTLNELTTSPETAGVLPSTVPRAEMVQQRLREYLDGQQVETELRARYTERHPDVVAQAQRNDNLRRELVMEIERARETAKADLDLALAFVDSIQNDKEQQLEIIDSILQRINIYNTDVLPLQREYDAADSAYKGLLQRIEQARMAADEDTSVVTIYQYGKPVSSPVAPKKKLILAGAIIVGLGAGIGLALLVHLYQDVVNEPYDIEVDLKQNLIGLIPHVIPEADEDDVPLARLTLANTFSAMNEAMASLRAALLVQGNRPKECGWVISITSISPQEGKTTISCNLALSMTKTFKRVLLIDGDMRRPRHHDVFDIPQNSQRLMEVLMNHDANEEEFARLPQRVPVANMHVILGHPVQGVSPTEVLETDVWERFLAWARAQYDVVVIDSPPLEAASDALIYGRHADDCILVCRQNRTRKGALRHATRDLIKNGSRLVGLVINDYKASALSYGSNYGGYGRYYGKYYHDADAKDRG